MYCGRAEVARAFVEIWPHLFLEMSNPKTLKVNSSWNIQTSKFISQDSLKYRVWQHNSLTSLSPLCLLSGSCPAVITATFISFLSWNEFSVASPESLRKYIFYHQLWGLALSLFPACFRSLLICAFAGSSYLPVFFYHSICSMLQSSTSAPRQASTPIQEAPQPFSAEHIWNMCCNWQMRKLEWMSFISLPLATWAMG